MKKNTKYLAIIILSIIIIPSVAMASWWNPFSWNWFKKQPVVEQVVPAVVQPTNIEVKKISSSKTTSVPQHQGCFESNGKWFNMTTGMFCDSTMTVSTVTYLTHQQIIDYVNQEKTKIESSINTSPAQIEINKLTIDVQNLQLQKQQVDAQGMVFAEYGAYENATPEQLQSLLTRPDLSGRSSNQQIYYIVLQKQKIDNQIQYDNHAITEDQNSIISYRKTSYQKAKTTCTTSNDISPNDLSFCQSLFN